MRFTTQEDAKIAAKKGHIAAAECSFVHHFQLATCTEKQFMAKMGTLYWSGNLIRSDYCALCIRFRLDANHGECRLGNDSSCCEAWSCCSLSIPDDSLDMDKFGRYKEAEKKMCRYIIGKYPELLKRKALQEMLKVDWLK